MDIETTDRFKLDGNNAVAEPEPSQITINDLGVIARANGESVLVFNNDNTELFRFNSNACPFNEVAIRFLVQIYSIGFIAGKLVGRQLTKQKIREILGSEL
jgi:hypothetical protein